MKLLLSQTLLAIIEALEKCGRLHRDISLDNIILIWNSEIGRRIGILIDWELSTEADDDGVARDYDRSVSSPGLFT